MFNWCRNRENRERGAVRIQKGLDKYLDGAAKMKMVKKASKNRRHQHQICFSIASVLSGRLLVERKSEVNNRSRCRLDCSK